MGFLGLVWMHPIPRGSACFPLAKKHGLICPGRTHRGIWLSSKGGNPKPLHAFPWENDPLVGTSGKNSSARDREATALGATPPASQFLPYATWTEHPLPISLSDELDRAPPPEHPSPKIQSPPENQPPNRIWLAARPRSPVPDVAWLAGRKEIERMT
jgi:hypothetical protein